MFFSSSNNACASALASSVLPTPVGPRNRKEPVSYTHLEQQELEAFCSEKEKEIREKNGILNECQQNYHAGKSRLDSLVNITERYEGYGSSIRRVMEKKSQMPGIVGVVADLLHVEKKYEVAMETALGGRIQNIVTDTESTAKQLVCLLYTSFLPRRIRK